MSPASFDDMVESSVKEAMSKTLGGEVWKAISFYFDVKTVAQEPRTFAKVLDRLFGASSKILQQVIGEILLSKLGGLAERRQERDFQDWIQMAKAKFASSSQWVLNQSRE